MTKEQEEAIEYFKKHINYFKEQIKFIEAVDSDYYDEEYELYKNRVKQFETILSMLKENSAEIEQKNTELAEKNAEIEKLKKFINYLQLKNIKDLDTKIYMANFINDNTPYTKDTKELENEEGIRTVDFTVKYFERKAINNG